MKHTALSARLRFVAVLAPLLAVGSTAAPAQTDMSSFYSDPSKYMLYGCKQLAQARPLLMYRIRKLETLTARANSGSGGGVASSLAYDNEYLTLRGDLRNLDARAVDRSCPPLPQGTEAPTGEPEIPDAPSGRPPGR